MQKFHGADPANIGKIVTVQTFDIEPNGDLILDTLVKHVGTLEAYILNVESFDFKLVGMPIVKAQYAEIYILGEDPKTGWRLGSRPRTSDPVSVERIARIRQHLRLSRAELALKLGVGVEHVRLLENGQRKPSLPVNEKLLNLEKQISILIS